MDAPPMSMLTAEGAPPALLRGDPALQAGQAQLLEMIARGAPLRDTLERLMLLIEAQSAGLYCSVMLLSDDGQRMMPIAAPSLPPAYSTLLEGVPIGPGVGSCGTAMFRKEAVVVSDIEHDPLWAPYKELAAPYGLRACWSTPIFLDRDTVLGSFAMYYKEVRSPGPRELDLIAVATHLAGIAIERKRRERELESYRHHLEQLVEQRTAELSAAKRRAERTVAALTRANTDLGHALDRLAHTQDELVQAQKLAALGAMVSGMAHELNTPIGNSLTTVSALADACLALTEQYARDGGLRRTVLEDFLGDTEEATGIITRNLSRAARLIDNFKHVAVDRAAAARARFELAAAVDDAVVAARPALEAVGIRVEVALPAPITLDSYPERLAELLGILLDNVRTHAFEGRPAGTVFIAAHALGPGQAELTVRDDGNGIAPEVLTRIFDPFFTTRLGGGSCGLGLNVAHNIARSLLGGQLSAESTYGAGATFRLRLPTRAPVAL